MSSRVLKQGEALFQEGDVSRSAYLIKRGQIRLFKKKGTAVVEIDTIRSGSLIGELAFLDQQPRSASAEAIVETEVIEISVKLLDDTLAKTPEWLKILLKTVTARLRAATNKIRLLEDTSKEYETDKYGNRSREFVFISVNELMKFSVALLAAAGRYGKEDGVNGIRFPLTVLERLAAQVLHLHDSKVAYLIEIFKTVDVLKSTGPEEAKPGLILVDNQFVDQMVWFLNEQNMQETSKQRTLSERGLLLLSLLVKCIDIATIPDGDAPQITINFAPKLNEEGKKVNPNLRFDELQELMDQKFVTNLLMENQDTINVTFNPIKTAVEYKIYWLQSEIDKLNEAKRKAGGGTTAK